MKTQADCDIEMVGKEITVYGCDGKPDSQQRVVRRCHCKYQTSSGGAWGYNLQQWTGNPAWEDMGNATHIEDVEKEARKYHTILIRCNGCGADIMREYPPNDKVSDGCRPRAHDGTQNV